MPHIKLICFDTAYQACIKHRVKLTRSCTAVSELASGSAPSADAPNKASRKRVVRTSVPSDISLFSQHSTVEWPGLVGRGGQQP
eukprot:4242937-Prymnesium_polylepis.1